MEESEKIEKLLKCPICFEKNFKPKMLPCQHTFCLKCTKKIVSKKTIGRGKIRHIIRGIQCALCRKWHDLTNRGPDGLANNLTLVQLLALTGHDQHPSCFRRSTSTDSEQDPYSIFEMLKCAGCPYQMEQPKMLPCQHTFCIDCLTKNVKIKRNHIKCKSCGKYHQLPINGAVGFPINRALLDLQALNQPTTVECELLCQDGSSDSDSSIDTPPNETADHAYFIRQILRDICPPAV